MSRANGAPPGRSIWDGASGSQPITSASRAGKDIPDAQDVDVVSRAVKDMQSIARADHQRVDLKELLVNSSREAQYSELPAGVSAAAAAPMQDHCALVHPVKSSLVASVNQS